MKKIFLVFLSILFLSAGCNSLRQVFHFQPRPQTAQNPNPTSTSNPAATSTSLSLPIKYTNTEYGFGFSLSEDWKGFSTLEKQWDGWVPDEKAGEVKTEHGPLITIRNPNWTAKNPYEDIPIMVFTLSQWNNLQQEKFYVSAAPIGPSELGRNSKYVFALPARYNYDFSTGFEEVEKIMSANPLQAF